MFDGAQVDKILAEEMEHVCLLQQVLNVKLAHCVALGICTKNMYE
jgi:hypothetical protein